MLLSDGLWQLLEFELLLSFELDVFESLFWSLLLISSVILGDRSGLAIFLTAAPRRDDCGLI